MNWILLGICAVTGVALTSCGEFGAGQTVDEPTTQEISQMEQQWGMPARKVHSRNSGMLPGGNDTTVAPDPAPLQVQTPAAPAPQQAAPAPPLEVDPPRLDAGTIKKLQ